MAAYGAALVLIAFLVSSLQWAQAGTDCTDALTGLTGCASFLTNASSVPDQKTCCTPLDTVLTTPSAFQCLCAQASSSSSSSSQYLQNALLLPKACNLTISVSQDNCTKSSSSSSPSTSTPSTPKNAGFMNASPSSHLLALTLLWAVVSFFT